MENMVKEILKECFVARKGVMELLMDIVREGERSWDGNYVVKVFQRDLCCVGSA